MFRRTPALNNARVPLTFRSRTGKPEVVRVAIETGLEQIAGQYLAAPVGLLQDRRLGMHADLVALDAIRSAAHRSIGSMSDKGPFAVLEATIGDLDAAIGNDRMAGDLTAVMSLAVASMEAASEYDRPTAAIAARDLKPLISVILPRYVSVYSPLRRLVLPLK